MVKVRCRNCNVVIESKSTHDMKKCQCGKIKVDGGNDYLRIIGDIDLCEIINEHQLQKKPRPLTAEQILEARKAFQNNKLLRTKVEIISFTGEDFAKKVKRENEKFLRKLNRFYNL